MGEIKHFGPKDLVVCNHCGTAMPEIMTDFHNCPNVPELEEETVEEYEEEVPPPIQKYAVIFVAGMHLVNTVLLLIITGILIAIVAK